MNCQHFVISILPSSCSPPPIAFVSFPVKQGIFISSSGTFHAFLESSRYVFFSLWLSVTTCVYMLLVISFDLGQAIYIFFSLFSWWWKPPNSGSLFFFVLVILKFLISLLCYFISSRDATERWHVFTYYWSFRTYEKIRDIFK